MEKLADISAFEALGATADATVFNNLDAGFSTPDDTTAEFNRHLQSLTDALARQQNEKSLELANVEGAANHAKISRLIIESAWRQLDEAFANGASPQAFQRIFGTLENGLTAARMSAGSKDQWTPDKDVETALQWLRSTWENRKE